MGQILLFALLAAFNPTLFAATTVMLLLPQPKRLLLGYLLGALMTSITLGLVIVFSLHGSSAEDTAKHMISPAMDLTLGGLALVTAFVLRPSRQSRPSREGRLGEIHRRRKEAKKGKGQPRWQRALSQGTALTTFAVGALLTLPGASYLVGLDHIADQDAGTAGSVALVLGFNLIMLILIELPLVGYFVAPKQTPVVVERFKDWLNRNGRRAAAWGLAAVGVLLVIRGVIELP